MNRSSLRKVKYDRNTLPKPSDKALVEGDDAPWSENARREQLRWNTYV